VKRLGVVVLLLSVAVLVGCAQQSTPKKGAAPVKPEGTSTFAPSTETGKKEAPKPPEEKLTPPAPSGAEKAAGEKKAAEEKAGVEEKKPTEEPKAVVEKKAAIEER
jgi:hypothetical protein